MLKRKTRTTQRALRLLHFALLLHFRFSSNVRFVLRQCRWLLSLCPFFFLSCVIYVGQRIRRWFAGGRLAHAFLSLVLLYAATRPSRAAAHHLCINIVFPVHDTINCSRFIFLLFFRYVIMRLHAIAVCTTAAAATAASRDLSWIPE